MTIHNVHFYVWNKTNHHFYIFIRCTTTKTNNFDFPDVRIFTIECYCTGILDLSIYCFFETNEKFSRFVQINDLPLVSTVTRNFMQFWQVFTALQTVRPCSFCCETKNVLIVFATCEHFLFDVIRKWTEDWLMHGMSANGIANTDDSHSGGFLSCYRAVIVGNGFVIWNWWKFHWMKLSTIENVADLDG